MPNSDLTSKDVAGCSGCLSGILSFFVISTATSSAFHRSDDDVMLAYFLANIIMVAVYVGLRYYLPWAERNNRPIIKKLGITPTQTTSNPPERTNAHSTSHQSALSRRAHKRAQRDQSATAKQNAPIYNTTATKAKDLKAEPKNSPIESTLKGYKYDLRRPMFDDSEPIKPPFKPAEKKPEPSKPEPAKRAAYKDLSATLKEVKKKPPEAVRKPSASKAPKDRNTKRPAPRYVQLPEKKPPPPINSWIEVGDLVTYVDVKTREQEKVIISHGTSVPEKGIINSQTPVARALLGKIKGQIIEVRLKPRGYKIEILTINKGIEDTGAFPKSQKDLQKPGFDLGSSKIYEGEAQGELWRDVAREGNRYNSGSLYDNYGDESEP